MLSPADARVLAADPELPGLALLLDPEQLGARLRAAHPALPHGTLRLTYLRHKPGMSCLAGYELTVGDRVHRFHARTVASAWGRKLERMSAGGAHPGSLGFGQLRLEEDLTLVRELPNDARLAALPPLFGADPWRALFGRGETALRDAVVTVLRYKPERRLVARLETGSARAVVKAYALREWADAAHASAAFRDDGPLRFAPVLRRRDDLRAIATGWLPGRLLTEALADGTASRAELEQVGEVLAILHAQPARLDRVRTVEGEAATLLRITEDLARLRPASSGVIRQLGMHLARQLMAGAPILVPTHGDFYAQQLLLDGERVGVLDLDEAALGDPALDLGNLIAHLERDVYRGRITPATLVAARAGLVAGYRRRAPLPPGVQLQTAVALFRVSHLPFRHREAGWADQIDALLARVTELACQEPVPVGAA